MGSTLARVCLFGLGIAIMVCSMEGHALAGVAVPEIDGSSVAIGLAGAASAVLILRARRQAK